MKNVQHDDLPLNLEPDENLHLEAPLLELRINSSFSTKKCLECDAQGAIENEFLKNALAFENTHSQPQGIRICDLLENPDMRPETELDELEVEQHLVKVIEMLASKYITVDFTGNYDNRTKYKFITEELFEESILHPEGPDMMLHFIYEEFHPNHEIDLENKAGRFISAWFEGDTDKLLWELGDRIIVPDGPILTKDQAKKQLQNTLSYYVRFSDFAFSINDINFKIIDDTGMAWIEGAITYKAIIAGNEVVPLQGIFRLYFCLEYGWWEICYFALPGFEFTAE